MKKIISILLCMNMVLLMPLTVVALSEGCVDGTQMKSIAVWTKDMDTGEITEETFTYTSQALNKRHINDLIHYGWMPEGKSARVSANGDGVPRRASILMNNNGIIGEDNRVEVSDTEDYPYSAVCYMEVDFKDGSSDNATAFMIGDNIAVTAAHCVYDGSDLAEKVKVWPGKDGFGVFGNPFGTAKSISILNPQYTSGNFFKDDWAVIILNEDIGNDTGWFGYTFYQPDILTAQFTVSGYPTSDRYHQYTMSGSAVGVIDDTYHIAHLIDVAHGQSGSPFYRTSGNIVYGVTSYWGDQVNYASQISEACYNYLNMCVQNY